MSDRTPQKPPLPAALWPAAFLVPALVLVALAYAPWLGLPMRHTTYLRQVLLVILAGPVLAVGWTAFGSARQAMRAALGSWPARLFLLAVWGQPALAWASLAWTSSAEATLSRAAELSALALWGTGWWLAASASGGLRTRLLAGHFGAGALIAAVGCATYLLLLCRGGPPPRLGAPLGNPNTVAVLMFFPLAGAVAWFLVPGSWFLVRTRKNGDHLVSQNREPGTRNQEPGTILPVLVLLIGVTALAAFALARSRSGLVGLGAAVLFMVGIHLRPKWRLAGAAGLAVVAAGTALWLTGDALRLARFEEWLRFGSVGPRYYGTVAGLGIFSDHPALGAGAGTFLLEAPAHLPREHYLGSYADSFLNLAHNEYAQTLAEGGLLGLGLMLALLTSAIWGGLRGAGTGLRVEGGRWKAGNGGGDPSSPSPSTLHFPPQSSALSLGLAVATAGVAASSLADPSLRLWDFTAFFYAAAALAAAGADGRHSAFGIRPSVRKYVALGLGAAAAATAVLWSIPDARRELDHCRAESAEARGNWAEAAGFYQKAAAGRGDFLSRMQARTALVSALDFAGHQARDPAQGQALIRRSLEEAQGLSAVMPHCPLILRKLAAARFSNGDRAGALAALVEAGRCDPYDRDFWMRFGRVLAAEPEAGRAALVAKAAAELGLASGDLAMLRSLAAAAGGDWTGALALADGLAPAAVTFLPLWFWRGVCLAEAGRAGDALLAFDRHLATEPLHAHGWYWRARALQAAGAPTAAKDAIAAFRRCVALDVEHDQARLELGGLLLAAGRPAEVLELLGPRLKASRREVDLAIMAAEAHWQLGQKADARRLLQGLLRRTDDPRIKAALEKLEGPGNAER